ncbi:PspC domain-containing protein [Amantichitinum ursilacus]|uniref:DNA-binding transcriptional activator PspC n=1 Tax=Amantichitinum ursilacus TaxID=857265 RepID=A0A0N1JSF7_9NEIS|nr:PspC domain-containing protein [Amantichitinum ursilacus]KPC52173.1 DNA-binding transcriptional activator PspC [Amantichitinum ursilacus]
MDHHRLYRSEDNRWISGVLGGVGEYLGISADKLRLVYVVLALFSFGFPCLILYLVLWFLMPLEPVIRSGRVHDQV